MGHTPLKSNLAARTVHHVVQNQNTGTHEYIIDHKLFIYAELQSTTKHQRFEEPRECPTMVKTCISSSRLCVFPGLFHLVNQPYISRVKQAWHIFLVAPHKVISPSRRCLNNCVGNRINFDIGIPRVCEATIITFTYSYMISYSNYLVQYPVCYT